MGEVSKENQESNLLGTNRDPLGELGTGSGVPGAPRASAGTESHQWAGVSFGRGPALGGLHIHRAEGLHVMKAKHTGVYMNDGSAQPQPVLAPCAVVGWRNLYFYFY